MKGPPFELQALVRSTLYHTLAVSAVLVLRRPGGFVLTLTFFAFRPLAVIPVAAVVDVPVAHGTGSLAARNGQPALHAVRHHAPSFGVQARLTSFLPQ